MDFPLRLVPYPTTISIQHCCFSMSTFLVVRSELEDEFRVSFREGAMGMTLSMDPDTRDAIVGKIVEQGQAFRAVRLTNGTEAAAYHFLFMTYCRAATVRLEAHGVMLQALVTHFHAYGSGTKPAHDALSTYRRLCSYILSSTPLVYARNSHANTHTRTGGPNGRPRDRSGRAHRQQLRHRVGLHEHHGPSDRAPLPKI